VKIRHTLAASAIALVTLGVGAANATTIVSIPGLYNTDASLAADGATDAHWTVNGGPAIVYNNPAYLTDAHARFIAAQAGGGYTLNPNSYDLTFDLTGLIPSTASLSGSYAGDNWADVYLNGNLIAQQPHETIYPNFQSLSTFSISGADFVNGVNTLEFVVEDTGAPSALLVTNLVGTASAVPEPAAWTMLLFGFFGIGSLVRAARRRETAAIA
jgi:hypothetical protein